MIFVLLLLVGLLGCCDATQVSKKEVYDYSYLCGVLNTIGYTVEIQKPGRLGKTYQAFNIISVKDPLGNVVLRNQKLGGELYSKLINIIQQTSRIQITTKSKKNKNGFAALSGITVNGNVYDNNFIENLAFLGECFNGRIKEAFEQKEHVILNSCSEVFKELRNFIPNRCQTFVQFTPSYSSQISQILNSQSPSIISPTTSVDAQSEEQPTYQLLLPDYIRQGYWNLAQLGNN